MTIRLLCAYSVYPANAIVTLDAATEVGLVAAKQAATDTTGGVPYVPPTIPNSTRTAKVVVSAAGTVLGLEGSQGAIIPLSGATATISPLTAGVGDTIHAALPAGVTGTLQFTRSTIPVPPAAPVKTSIAGAVANAVNMLAYTIAPADAGYSIGCDASNQVSASTGVPIPAPAPGAIMYGAIKIDGDSQFNTGASGLSSFYLKKELDVPVTAVRVCISCKQQSGTPGTWKAQVAVTDTMAVDTVSNAYLPTRAGVVHNDVSSLGWMNATFDGGATSKTLPLVPDNDTQVSTIYTDWMPLSSIPLANGGATFAHLIRAVQTDAAGQYMQEQGSNALYNSQRGLQAWYREYMTFGIANVDAIANPSNVPGTNGSGYGAMIWLEYQTTTAHTSIALTGDSREECAYSDYQFDNWVRRSAMELSTPSHPITIANFAGSGHSQVQFTNVIKDAINAGYRPTIIVYPGFSQNGFSTATFYNATLDAFIAWVRAVPGMANTKFIITTDYSVNGDGQNAQAHARALVDNVLIFLFNNDDIITDKTTPGAYKIKDIYNTSSRTANPGTGDGIHAGALGLDAMKDGITGYPGMKALLKTIIGIP